MDKKIRTKIRLRKSQNLINKVAEIQLPQRDTKVYSKVHKGSNLFLTRELHGVFHGVTRSLYSSLNTHYSLLITLRSTLFCLAPGHAFAPSVTGIGPTINTMEDLLQSLSCT
jgi:hypothetical protein